MNLDPAKEPRPRSYSSHLMAALEGLISGFVFFGAASVAVPIIPDRASLFLRAMRSGTCLALGTPSFILMGRIVFLAWSLRIRTVQQPSLGFVLPPGFDEHAVLDLYVMGLSAGVLGVWVPTLEVLGTLLGIVLVASGSSVAASISTTFLVFIFIALGLYLACGVCLRATAPFDGLITKGTTPTKVMWVLCAVGHCAILYGSFYSPDIGRAVGFVLGFIHIVRLLQQAFSWPGGSWEEVVLNSEERV